MVNPVRRALWSLAARRAWVDRRNEMSMIYFAAAAKRIAPTFDFNFNTRMPSTKS
jgi:hypothetical protein